MFDVTLIASSMLNHVTVCTTKLTVEEGGNIKSYCTQSAKNQIILVIFVVLSIEFFMLIILEHIHFLEVLKRLSPAPMLF